MSRTATSSLSIESLNYKPPNTCCAFTQQQKVKMFIAAVAFLGLATALTCGAALIPGLGVAAAIGLGLPTYIIGIITAGGAVLGGGALTCYHRSPWYPARTDNDSIAMSFLEGKKEESIPGSSQNYYYNPTTQWGFAEL